MLYYQWSYKVKEDSHITIIIIIIVIIMMIIIIIPIMIGALGTISGNAKAWNGRLSLPDIFGSAQLSAILGTAHCRKCYVSKLWDCCWGMTVPRKRTTEDHIIIIIITHTDIFNIIVLGMPLKPWTTFLLLTIIFIPWARMDSESIEYEAEGIVLVFRQRFSLLVGYYIAY